MLELYLLFLFFCFLFFVLLKLIFNLKNRAKSPLIELKEISVIIPFRNESENIEKLINSLKRQSKLPFDILFINDHSTDDSQEKIEKEILGFENVRLLELPSRITGKKQAINYGIQQAKSPWVLTLDADVELDSRYFSYLEKSNLSDLTILPVISQGKSFLGKFFATEYLFFNSFNYLISSIYPISASGANLLFHREKADYESQLVFHQHLSSGDDYFLLKYFRRNNKKITFLTAKELAVTTDSPDDFSTYFSQRVRWLSKSKEQMTMGEILVSIFLFLYFSIGFFAFFHFLFVGNWKFLIATFIIRSFLDISLFLNYNQRLGTIRHVFFLPLFQVFYPIILLLVFIQSLYKKPSWKGRKL